MSQVASPSKPYSPGPSNGGPAHGGNDATASNRDALRTYVEQAARNMRRAEFFYGLLWWLTVIVFIVTAVVLVDHWLCPLTKLARFTVLAGLVGWSCWWLPRRVMPPMIHPIHIEHAARTIEKQFPDCKDSLISWLQLSRDDSKTPKGVVSYLGRYAVRNLNGQDAQSVVDSATVVRLAAAFFGCLLCSAIYMFSSPKSGITSIARVLMPWANIAPAARVHILEVLPGNTTVTQGSFLPVTVTVRGMHQGDKVSIRFDLSDSQLVGESLPLIPEIERISYKIDLGKSFSGIHQPLKYWIHAGDAIEGPFDVKVQVVPLVAVERTELQYPAYTKLKPRSLLQNGSFEAPEGTRVELFASANQRMKTARLEFDPVLEQSIFQTARDLVNMEILDQQIKGQWVALLDEKQSSPTTTSYRIHATNDLGVANADPVLYQVKVIRDLPPEVSIDSDVPTTLEIPVSGSIELELRANDPDYGLTAMYAFGAEPSSNPGKSNLRTELFRETIFESEEGTLGQVSRTWNLTPSNYEWKPGREFDLFVEACDNRCDPRSQQAQPNRSLSTPVRVRIVEDQKPDTDDQPQPQTEDPSKQEAKGTKPKTKWEVTPDKKESGSSKDGNNKNTQPQDAKSKNGNPDDASKGRGVGDSSTNESQTSDGQGKSQGQSSGKGQNEESTPGQGQEQSSGQGRGNGKGQSSGSADSMSSESTSSTTRAVAGKPSQSSPSQENAKPPSHDGEAIERINQFRQEQQKQNDRQADNPTSEDSPKNKSDTEQRNDPSTMNRSTQEGEQDQDNAAGKDGAGKEGAGKDGAGKEESSKKEGSQGPSNGSQDSGAETGADGGSEDGGDSGNSASKSSKGETGGSPSSGVNRGGKTPEGGGGTKGSGGETKTNGPEKANLEYAEKTTDMVLDYLDRQRDQPDPELLKRMGWTAEDLRKFADRWKSAREQSRLTPEKRAEFEAALRSLGLRHADRRPTRLEDRDDQLKGMQEEGVRLRPPETLREQFEAFRKAAGKLNKSP